MVIFPGLGNIHITQLFLFILTKISCDLPLWRNVDQNPMNNPSIIFYNLALFFSIEVIKYHRLLIQTALTVQILGLNCFRAWLFLESPIGSCI